MKKTMTALVAGIMFVALTLTGCSTQENGSSGTTATPSPTATTTQENLPKISYVSYSGDQDCGTVLVITADRKVKRYDITWSYKRTDLFAGKLPSEDDYRNRLTEYEISEDEWNALINALNENRFEQLPEDISIKGFDLPASYMQVETADGVHESGGYGASVGDGDENVRFGTVEHELYKIEEAHHPSSRCGTYGYVVTE